MGKLLAGLPNTTQLIHAVIRLVAATLLGGVIGVQRERWGKSAGLRTHMLVTVGTTLFVLATAGSGMSLDGVFRVIQGLTTGIGFIGAGFVLKLSKSREIQGLTTAAIGVTVGLGSLGLALLGTALTWIILTFTGRNEFKQRIKRINEENRARKT